jgi:hypothetical protein
MGAYWHSFCMQCLRQTEHDIKSETIGSGFRARSSSIAVAGVLFARLGCRGDAGLNSRRGMMGEMRNDGLDFDRVVTPSLMPDK